MLGDKKGMAAMILARAKPEPKDDESGESGAEALDAAAQDVLDAVKSDSIDQLKLALKSFFDICCASEPDDEY